MRSRSGKVLYEEALPLLNNRTPDAVNAWLATLPFNEQAAFTRYLADRLEADAAELRRNLRITEKLRRTNANQP